MVFSKCKKVISAIMLMMLMVNILPSINVFAAGFSGSCGSKVVYSFNKHKGRLVITGKGKMSDYSLENKAPWDSYKDSIKSVIIRGKVDSIGKRAFSHCKSLESIEIGENVSSIGEYAFSCCQSLTHVHLPDKVSSIGAHAFTHCSDLDWVDIDNNASTIGKYAFSHCSNLQHLQIGTHEDEDKDGVSIGDYAFYYCVNLYKVIYIAINEPYPSGSFVFEGCKNLKKVTVVFGYEGEKFCGVDIDIAEFC